MCVSNYSGTSSIYKIKLYIEVVVVLVRTSLEVLNVLLRYEILDLGQLNLYFIIMEVFSIVSFIWSVH